MRSSVCSNPPATGDYYISLQQYAGSGGPQAVKAAFETQKKLRQRPWTANENTTLSAWLRANEKPMAALAEAVKKPRYYNPIIPDQGPNGSRGLYRSRLTGVLLCDEVALAFACRATLYVGHNQPAQAWQDLLTCHRLARFVARGGTLVEGLVGVKLDQIASTADSAFLARVKPNAQSVELCIRDLFALPPLPDLADKIDLTERFMFLDTVMLTHRNGVAHLEVVAKELTRWAPGYTDEALPGIDWNVAMERANKWYDRMAAALREPDRLERSKKLGEIESEIVRMEKSLNPAVLKDMSQTPATRSAMIGDMSFSFLFPHIRKQMDERDRTQQLFDSTVVAYACVWYHRFNGRFPAKLADLSPTYLNSVPKDLFNGKELVYSAGEGGFSILSIAQNGLDEGGQGNSHPGFGDDIVVRFPSIPGQ